MVLGKFNGIVQEGLDGLFDVAIVAQYVKAKLHVVGRSVDHRALANELQILVD